ncbi:MAG: hypothetical protein VB115_14375 [Christensenellaceae bacterium]|nr:hypothetical protein [Christensenellaceae bacterium]
MNYNSLVEKQLKDAMKREGRLVHVYGQPDIMHTCLFRIDNNRDRNSERQYLTAYVRAASGLTKGMLLSCMNKIYIVHSAETPENAVYRRLSLLECNTTISFVADGKAHTLPLQIGVLKSAAADDGKMISVIGGYIEGVTADCEASRALAINTKFHSNEMGGRFECENVIYIDGLATFTFKRIPTSSATYTLKLDIPVEQPVGKTITPGYTAKADGENVTNAVIAWRIDNPLRATVNEDGTITFLTPGEVTVTAHWTEYDVSASERVTVVPEAQPHGEITGETEIPYATSGTYGVNYYDGSGALDTTSPCVWSLDLPSALTGKVTIKSQSNRSITIQVVDNDRLIGQRFNIVAEIASARISKEIMIASWGW